jgi:hypothetical protein
MKHFILVSIVLLITTLAHTQTIPPPYINYQAVLYDVNGPNPNAVLANQSFSTYVNIQDELGNLLYKEEHYASTDANGQITVKIGDGVYLQGTITNFNQINWGTGKYYLIVDFDINGTISSTAPEQLVTVPYTFYAGKAGNGMTAVADNGNGTLTFTYANGQTYITPTLSGMQGPIGPAGPQGPQGIQGIQGPQGVAGTNGLNALIKTSTEPAGSNCANGGTKIETGLDANNNGVLEAGEVNGSQTKYVCNGAGSSGGSVQFSNLQVYSTPGTYTWTCPAGVTKVMVEVWGAGGGGRYSGTGGGGGGYGKSILAVTSGNSYSIVVGAGGAAAPATNTNGSAGGNSSFNNQITSTGGSGGHATNGTNSLANGGNSNATITFSGASGIWTNSRSISGGDGGNGGRGGVGWDWFGENGSFPGGGGGCASVNSYAPGSGANGCIIISY